MKAEGLRWRGRRRAAGASELIRDNGERHSRLSGMALGRKAFLVGAEEAICCSGPALGSLSPWL